MWLQHVVAGHMGTVACMHLAGCDAGTQPDGQLACCHTAVAGQLLHQQLVEPQFGWPPAVLAKGEGVTFTGGAPIAVTGPEVSGAQLQAFCPTAV